MKKITVFILILSLMVQLSACGFLEEYFLLDKTRSDKEVTTEATEVELPTEVPTEAPTEEQIQQTTVETTEAVELLPMTDVPYILEPPAEACVFKEPDANSKFVRSFGHQGAYTIVEERYDDQGNLWGKLKSGIGWTNLTDPFCGGPDAPKVIAAYASKQVLSGDYHLAGIHTGDQYKVNVSILAHETVYDVSIRDYDMINERVGSARYTLDQLDPEKPIVAHLAFPGDFSAFLVYYTDESGVEHEILLWMSMDDSNFIGWY